MGRLDEVDLSPRLNREEEERELKRAGTPPGAAAADARRPDRRSRTLGPPLMRRLRGLGRLRQGRGDQTPGGAAGSAPRPRRPVRRARARTRSATTSSALLAGAAGLGRDDRLRPLLVRAGAGRAGRGLRQPRRSGGAPTRRSTASSAASPRRARSSSSSGCTSPPRSSCSRFEARADDPAEDLEADRRGLAKPREAPRIRRGRGGDARAHRPPARALARDRRRSRSAMHGSRWSAW